MQTSPLDLSPRQRTWLTAALAAVSVMLLAPIAAHAYIGFYGRWLLDNYCLANTALQLGLLRAGVFWYYNWTGRFATIFLDGLTGILGTQSAPMQAALALLIWLALLVIIFSQLRLVSAKPASRWAALLLAALVLFLTLDNSPLLAQSLYWTTGLHNYTAPPVAGTALAAALLVGSRRGSRPRERWLWLVIVFVLAAIATGFTEIYSAMQFTALAAALLLGWLIGSAQWRRSGWPLVAVATLGTGLGIVFVLAAPGNAVRQLGYAPPGSPAEVARLGYAITYTFLVGTVKTTWLELFGVAALSGLIGFALGDAQAPAFGSRRQALLALLWLPVAGVAVLAFAFTAVAYATSAFPIPRTGIISAYAVAWLAVLTSFAAGRALRTLGVWERLGRAGRPAAAAAMLGVLVLLAYAARSSLQTLATQPTYSAFAAQWDAADAQLRQGAAAGVPIVRLPWLPNVFLLNDYLSTDPTSYFNQCMADYYGVAVSFAEN